MSKYSEAKARKLEAYLAKHAAEHAIIAEQAQKAGEASLQKPKDPYTRQQYTKERVNTLLSDLDAFCSGIPLSEPHLIDAIRMAVHMSRLYIKEVTKQ
jgi:hypothetical protein